AAKPFPRIEPGELVDAPPSKGGELFGRHGMVGKRQRRNVQTDADEDRKGGVQRYHDPSHVFPSEHVPNLRMVGLAWARPLAAQLDDARPYDELGKRRALVEELHRAEWEPVHGEKIVRCAPQEPRRTSVLGQDDAQAEQSAPDTPPAEAVPTVHEQL